MTGLDAIDAVKTIGFTAGTLEGEDIGQSGRAVVKEFVVDGTEQFYCAWAGIQTTGDDVNIRSVLRIERTG